MKLCEVRPLFYTQHLQETISFYTSKLGFTCVAETDIWASLRRDSIEISISALNQHIPFTEPKFTGAIYIITEDVAKLWEELEHSVKISYPLETFDYGMKEFAIYDNNGYLLQFGEEQ